MDEAVKLFEGWARRKLEALPGATLEVARLPGRTPVIFFETPATRSGGAETILLYGHLDKQPEIRRLAQRPRPVDPKTRRRQVVRPRRRGSAMPSTRASPHSPRSDAQGVERPRCVGLIETCEESGSYDLLPYVDALRERLGKVGLVVCLDSGAGNYDQLWLTTSLRGLTGGQLTVEVLTEGVHSGDASGVVPDSFRIARSLLSRLEDAKTGEIRLEGLWVDIPQDRWSRPAAPPRPWASRSGPNSRSWTACGRWRMTRSS